MAILKYFKARKSPLSDSEEPLSAHGGTECIEEVNRRLINTE